MRNLAPAETRQFVDKADHFLLGMQHLKAADLSRYRTAICLLAVHSAISLNDAITVGVTGSKGRYQDHARAADDLDRLCKTRRVPDLGVKHFRRLLAQKSAAAYDHRPQRDQEVHDLTDKALRFSAWAYTYFKEILGEKTNP